MDRVRQWGRRLVGRDAARAGDKRRDDGHVVPTIATSEVQFARQWAANPERRAVYIAQATEHEARQARQAQAAARQQEQVWQALDRPAQRQAVAEANSRPLEALPTIAELRADAHERTARFGLTAPGQVGERRLPFAYLDVRPLDSNERHHAGGARWAMSAYTYDSTLRGHTRTRGYVVQEVAGVVDYARDERVGHVPVYTEDRALRKELAAQHIPLGQRLTGVEQEYEHLAAGPQPASQRQREAELER